MEVPYSDIDFAIENFSCWSFEVNGSNISFPLSDIANSFVGEIFLELYPRGQRGLEKNLVLKFFNGWFASGLEVSFIVSDGSPIYTESLNIKDLDHRTEFFTGPEYEKVVDAIRMNEPYHKDLLTIRFRKKCNYFAKRHVQIAISVLTTSIKINSKIFKECKIKKDSWNDISTIHHSLHNDADDRLEFHAFQIDSQSKTSVKFKVLPVVLKTTNTFAKVTLFYQVGKGTIVKFQELEHVFRGWSEPFLFKSLPIPEDLKKNFYIILRLKIVTGNAIKSFSHMAVFPCEIDMDCTNSPQIRRTAAFLHPEDSTDVLTRNLLSLYLARKFCDFQLHCGGVTFPVHKWILSARSPVFKGMLSNNMREASSGSAYIEDLDPRSLDRFLSFLYSGKMCDIDWDDALKLYYAADKYQVPTLKSECVKILCDEVSVSNLGDIMSLAYHHQDDRLTSAANKFFLKNYDRLCRTKEWVEFSYANPFVFNRAVELRRR